jgi:hypothetical protein
MDKNTGIMTNKQFSRLLLEKDNKLFYPTRTVEQYLPELEKVLRSCAWNFTRLGRNPLEITVGDQKITLKVEAMYNFLYTTLFFEAEDSSNVYTILVKKYPDKIQVVRWDQEALYDALYDANDNLSAASHNMVYTLLNFSGEERYTLFEPEIFTLQGEFAGIHL